MTEKSADKTPKPAYEALWSNLKKTQICMFGLPPRSLSDLCDISPVSQADEIYLVNKPRTQKDDSGKTIKHNPPMVSALVAGIDEALNVRRTATSEARIERFQVDSLLNGMVRIKPITATS